MLVALVTTRDARRWSEYVSDEAWALPRIPARRARGKLGVEEIDALVAHPPSFLLLFALLQLLRLVACSPQRLATPLLLELALLHLRRH